MDNHRRKSNENHFNTSRVVYHTNRMSINGSDREKRMELEMWHESKTYLKKYNSISTCAENDENRT